MCKTMVFLTFFVNQRDNQEVNFEAFFTFIVHHNVVIFQWLVVCVLAIAMLYLALRIFAKDKLSSDNIVIVESPRTHTMTNSESGSSMASPMAPSVDEIMSQPGMARVGEETPIAKGEEKLAEEVTAPEVSAVADGADPGQLANHQEELKAKELEIATLKSEIESSKASEDSTDLKAKLEELEAKLAEYEILEDDIADLSHFKEENARLKEELEALKSGGGVSPSTTEEASTEGSEAEVPAEPAVTPPTAETAEPDKENLMAEFEASLGAEDLEEQVADAVSAETGDTAAAPAAEEVNDGADFVAEFEAAVQQQKGAENPPEEEVTTVGAETPPPTTSEPEPKVEVPSPQDSAAQQEDEPEMPTGDDILAEFAQSLGPGEEPSEEAGSGEEAGIESGALDTDKVLAEMADLATTDSGDDEGSALEEEMDTEKMAEEASRLLNGE